MEEEDDNQKGNEIEIAKWRKEKFKEKKGKNKQKKESR